MKKILAPSIIGLLALSACTTKEVVREVPVTQPTVTTAPYVPPVSSNSEPTYSDYQDYLDHVNSQSLAALTVSDSDLIQYGDNICAALDGGMSFGGLVQYFQDEVGVMSDDTATFVSSIVAAAVVYLCPEYNDAMQSFLGNV